jgi:hypothetical protein
LIVARVAFAAQPFQYVLEITALAFGVRARYPLVGAVGKSPLSVVVGRRVETPFPGKPVRAVDPQA